MTGDREVMPPASGMRFGSWKTYAIAVAPWTAFAAARMTLITKSGWEAWGRGYWRPPS